MVIHARVSDWLRMQSAYLRRCDVAHFECSSWHSIIVVDHRRLAREKRRVLRRPEGEPDPGRPFDDEIPF